LNNTKNRFVDEFLQVKDKVYNTIRVQ